MRAYRAAGLACLVSTVVAAVLLGSAGPAESGPGWHASRGAGPSSRVSVDATPPAGETLAPVDAAIAETAPVAPADVEAPCAPCSDGSAAPTPNRVEGAPRSQLSTSESITTDSALTGVSFSLLPTGTRWVDGTQVGAWRSVYDGYGTTQVKAGRPPVFSQHPKAAASTEVTHGALAVTVAQYRDVDFTVRQRTVSQLRSPSPNPWEVPWALWAYTDDQHFYYLVLKPNGWELGKEDPAYPGSQRFLATGASPSFSVGTWHTVRVRQTGNTIEAWGDGRLLTRFVDRERPYSSGHLGLYTEDAHVEHADLVLRRG